MRRLRTTSIIVAWLAVLALVGYEVVQKAPETGLGPLPGSDLAAQADRVVRYRALTGVMPVDQLLHESLEACLYYEGLATGRVRRLDRHAR